MTLALEHRVLVHLHFVDAVFRADVMVTRLNGSLPFLRIGTKPAET